MHETSFMALAIVVSKQMTYTQKKTKVYAHDANDDGKAIPTCMSRFCVAGETKIRVCLDLQSLRSSTFHAYILPHPTEN